MEKELSPSSGAGHSRPSVLYATFAIFMVALAVVAVVAMVLRFGH